MRSLYEITRDILQDALRAKELLEGREAPQQRIAGNNQSLADPIHFLITGGGICPIPLGADAVLTHRIDGASRRVLRGGNETPRCTREGMPVRNGVGIDAPGLIPAHLGSNDGQRNRVSCTCGRADAQRGGSARPCTSIRAAVDFFSRHKPRTKFFLP